MNRRRLLKIFLAALSGLFSWNLTDLFAQSRRLLDSQRKRKRLQSPQLRVKKLSPELEQILVEWAAASGNIRKLRGEHQRLVYNLVFEVENRAQGKFYYEAPDKGRMDLRGMKIPKDATTRKKGKSGKPFQIESDHPERWICNGSDIRQINDVEKTVEIFPIPPDARGVNIMDGPLPFLFGLPPEKAKRRFELKLVENSSYGKITHFVHLHVKPRWESDARNWQEAEVILDKRQQYLPFAVKLIDPGGNLETIFKFSKFKINKRDSIFGKGPFKPLLRGYKIKVNEPEMPVQRVVQRNPNLMPRLTGLPAEAAKTLLQKLGYDKEDIEWRRGDPATKKKLVYVVYKQFPKPETQLDKSKPIYLLVYDKIP
jgi:TIGR03009 family protein